MGIKSTLNEIVTTYYTQYVASICNVLQGGVATCHYIFTIGHKYFNKEQSLEDLYYIIDILTYNQSKLAHLFTLDTNLRISTATTVSACVVNNITKKVLYGVYMSSIEAYNCYGEFFNKYNYRLDNWSDYNGTDVDSFDFNSFFYDVDAQSTEPSTPFVLYSDCTTSDTVFIRGVTFNINTLNEKIIYS